MEYDIVFSNDPDGSLTRAVQRGQARRLRAGLYTYDTETPLEDIVRANLWTIVGHFFPNAVITDRTRRQGLTPTPGQVWYVFCTHPGRRRDINLPGVMISARSGPGPQPDDTPHSGGSHLASEARALLDNARVTRPHGDRPARTLTRVELEAWIDELVALRGDTRVNRIRDRARGLAAEWSMEKQFNIIDGLIGAGLGTSDNALQSEPLGARRSGKPFDQRRDEMLATAAAWLEEQAPVVLTPVEADRTRFVPFFEAYFSNYIEGTEFTIQEARRIVFDNEIPQARPKDAHDIIGTYRLVSNNDEMQRTPASPTDLVEFTRQRHGVLMDARPEVGPGVFKSVPNRVGSYVFVEPELVEGTLLRAFSHYNGLTSPLNRALFMMFAVSEIHPFADGNGRIARIMMNAELVAAAQPRIIIPTIYRNNYLSGLRALSTGGRASPLFAVLEFAQRWTNQIDWSEFEFALEQLEAANAFVDPTEADAAGIRLQLQPQQ